MYMSACANCAQMSLGVLHGSPLRVPHNGPPHRIDPVLLFLAHAATALWAHGSGESFSRAAMFVCSTCLQRQGLRYGAQQSVS